MVGAACGGSEPVVSVDVTWPMDAVSPVTDITVFLRRADGDWLAERAETPALPWTLDIPINAPDETIELALRVESDGRVYAAQSPVFSGQRAQGTLSLALAEVGTCRTIDGATFDFEASQSVAILQTGLVATHSDADGIVYFDRLRLGQARLAEPIISATARLAPLQDETFVVADGDGVLRVDLIGQERITQFLAGQAAPAGLVETKSGVLMYPEHRSLVQADGIQATSSQITQPPTYSATDGNRVWLLGPTRPISEFIASADVEVGPPIEGLTGALACDGQLWLNTVSGSEAFDCSGVTCVRSSGMIPTGADVAPDCFAVSDEALMVLATDVTASPRTLGVKSTIATTERPGHLVRTGLGVLVLGGRLPDGNPSSRVSVCALQDRPPGAGPL